MPQGLIDPQQLPTTSLDWGAIKWLVTPRGTPGAALTFGEVVLLPGKGHDRHNHPYSEEILYILSGVGEQMIDDQVPFPIKAGDTLYIPQAVFHATLNTGWQPLRFLALYNPGGPEQDLTMLADYQELPPATPPVWHRAR